ncbi:dienelactone hydrolase family protein [Sandarakinorhabdus sp.]|uniref:dienelactone hydrolase family protein n=1 Tax=Sandarakinorhabdus sp. TaxID=1916663 RepID=UPI00286DC9D2|nr:dienelactone hydrolase family protein [Sandarakinorhabdus sp.]
MPAFSYADEDTICEGHIAVPAGAGPFPAVLVAHNWGGQMQADNDAAERLAAQGYVGIAIDVYGKGVRGEPMGDNSALMNPWMADRAALQQRLLAAVTAAAAHPAVDADRMAIMGYCFGGLCALDVARSADARIKGAISFHGVYAPNGLPQKAMSAKVLVLHGWEDPMCPPAATVALAAELTAAGADWQIHAYGGTYHAFTAPAANNPAGGVAYSADADRRSWQALSNFLAETL